MTVNPLVAGALDGPKDIWAGVWIVEDIQLIEQGIKNGSWIDGTLGVVGAGLDALALVSDPAGALLQYGIAWLIEHVKPLSDALDWLAGDPGQIAGHAQTWRNIASSLKATTDDLGIEAGRSTQDWLGAAGDAYRTWANEQRQAIAGIAKAAGLTDAGLTRDRGANVGRPGSGPKIREVASEAELKDYFDALTRNGATDISPPGFPGRMVQLPDGTIVNWRTKSKTTGSVPTIDVNPGNGQNFKVHVNPNDW
jgi:uncharacterized protein YukE